MRLSAPPSQKMLWRASEEPPRRTSQRRTKNQAARVPTAYIRLFVEMEENIEQRTSNAEHPRERGVAPKRWTLSVVLYRNHPVLLTNNTKAPEPAKLVSPTNTGGLRVWKPAIQQT